MRLFRQMFFLGLVSLLFLGCAKKSGIEGKVVDGKGHPVANVKIIINQIKPIEGYEHFETTTGSDGTFRFKNVFPNADYYIDNQVNNYQLKNRVIVHSAPEGQMSILQPIVIPSDTEKRFTSIKDGVISDSKTGLQWAQDAGQKMTWYQANEYVHTLKIGGYSDWRLPSKEELESLISYAKSQGINYYIYELFEIIGFKNVQADDYWSSTTSGQIFAGNAWIVNMLVYDGQGMSDDMTRSHYVWPVRARH